MKFNLNKGVGLNLRLDFIDEVLKTKPDVSHFEVIADNWLSDGPHHKKLEKIREDYPILFHCVGMNIGGVNELNSDYLQKVKGLVQKFEPVQVSDHLAMQAHEGMYLHDLLPFPFNEESLKSTEERVNYIQDCLGQKILIENLSYYVEFKNNQMSEAQFLNQLSKQTDCDLLVDLNNIWVNQLNLNYDINEFIKHIDFKRVKEIHLAAPELIDGVYVDTHGGPVHDDVLKLLKSLKSQINCPITYERDRNIPPLIELLNEVQRIKEVLHD